MKALPTLFLRLPYTNTKKNNPVFLLFSGHKAYTYSPYEILSRWEPMAFKNETTVFIQYTGVSLYIDSLQVPPLFKGRAFYKSLFF